jgi:hypothetical protein
MEDSRMRYMCIEDYIQQKRLQEKQEVSLRMWHDDDRYQVRLVDSRGRPVLEAGIREFLSESGETILEALDNLEQLVDRATAWQAP